MDTGKKKVKKKDRKNSSILFIIIALILLFIALRSCGGKNDSTDNGNVAKNNKDNIMDNSTKTKASEKAVNITDIKAVSSGNKYSLVITDNGTLWGWGSNKGKLGDRIYADSLTSIEIMKDVKSVSAGNSHVLAVGKDGILWAWGSNKYGQLGDGTKTDSNAPKKVLEGVEAAEAGELFSLALKKDGTLWAWGRNNQGQLGNKSVVDSASPFKILDGVKKISAGDIHSLVIMKDDTLWGWGSDQYGQLAGNSNSEEKSISGSSGLKAAIQTEPVKLMEGISEAAAGGLHSVVLDFEGSVWTWGANGDGQLGNNWEGEWVSGRYGGRYMNISTPQKVMSDVYKIDAGYINSTAVKKDGSLWLWGGNGYGQIGDGTSFTTPAPKQVLDNVNIISQGRYHVMAVKGDGSLWTWGSNEYGELGDGNKSKISEPVKILEDIKQVSSYSQHTLAVKNDGTLYAFGVNSVGQLGDGTWNNTSIPKPVLGGVLQSATGSSHSLCIKEDGTLWAWGSNNMGQLGNGKDEEVHTSFSVWEGGHPVYANSSGKKEASSKSWIYQPFEIMKDVTQIGAGWSTSYALKPDGTLLSWGFNELGHMGDGTKKNTSTPKKTLDGVKTIIPLMLAVKNDKTLWTWGYNIADPYDKQSRKALDNVVSAAYCDRSYLAVKNDGTLWVWGEIYKDIIDKKTMSDKIIEPVQIGEDVKLVAADHRNIFIVQKDGTLWADSFNSISLANLKKENSKVLKYAEVRQVMKDVRDVILGANHVLVLKEDGTVWGFGDNNLGQLGDGKRFFVPQQITRKK